MIARFATHNKSACNQIIEITAWGFTIAIASSIFFYAGYWIDSRFGTAPTFMTGLLLLAVFLCVGRFYWEAWLKMKQQ
ncbi:MAG: AtpZ/AtpI family protein [Syntrophaceae bacterium]|nr:AtpZ/AtpI family protein [Syntrophaceae bacterium]